MRTLTQILLILAAVLGVVPMAQAAFINCSPGQLDVVVTSVGQTSTNFTCNPGAGSGAGATDDNLSGDGSFITGIRLRVSGILQDNAAVTGHIYSVLFTTNNGSGFTNVSCTASVAGDGNNQANASCISPTGAFFAVPGSPDVVAAFTVTVTGAPGSNPLPFNASASVLYEVTNTVINPVPEPATCAMIGLGLGALALARRK